jgi:outer membrane protein OmpA-like peptidoglycan-associated protein
MRATITTGISLIVAATLLAAGPAFAAERASKQETVGLGVGATVGAIAAGPVGFIVGAAVGAKIGDEFHRKETEITTLHTSLERSQDRASTLERNIAGLNADIDTLNRDLSRATAGAGENVMNLLKTGIEMDLLFRTAEHELPEATRQKLSTLGRSLAGMPDVTVRLDGFADERGDEDYNHELSVRRAEAVRQVLTANGVTDERIALEAHGESPAADATADSLALERKVRLTLRLDETPSVARIKD